MANSIARGRVRTPTTATTESRIMTALVPCTSLILDIHVTCQNKVSADQNHVTISQVQVYNTSRSHVFLS